MFYCSCGEVLTVVAVEGCTGGGVTACNKHVSSGTATVKLVAANNDQRLLTTMFGRCRHVLQVPCVPTVRRHATAAAV